MKLELGKNYVTRNGLAVMQVVRVDEDRPFTYTHAAVVVKLLRSRTEGEIGWDLGEETGYSEEGKWKTDCVDHECDLVRPYSKKKPLVVKVGRRYVDGRGNEVIVKENIGIRHGDTRYRDFIFRSEDGLTYRRDGAFSTLPTSRDLVARVKDLRPGDKVRFEFNKKKGKPCKKTTGLYYRKSGTRMTDELFTDHLQDRQLVVMSVSNGGHRVKVKRQYGGKFWDSHSEVYVDRCHLLLTGE